MFQSQASTMKLSHTFLQGPLRTPSSVPLDSHSFVLSSNVKRVFEFKSHSVRFLNCVCNSSGPTVSSTTDSSLPVIASSSDYDSGVSRKKPKRLEALEEDIKKVIYRCWFMAIMGVFGSLIGSILCFIKGCTFVTEAIMVYFINLRKVILMLVKAINVYLLGTFMLVFGMGLYELFVSNLGSAGTLLDQKGPYRSNLFGLFPLKQQPNWLDNKTMNELKTKLGHGIVMLLLIGLFDKKDTWSQLLEFAKIWCWWYFCEPISE